MSNIAEYFRDRYALPCAKAYDLRAGANWGITESATLNSSAAAVYMSEER
jgi:hypothetical protein